MKEAILYERLPNRKVRCNICAHYCVIPLSKKGVCVVRQNVNGILYALNYGKLVAQHVDPIEKKPLYHFYPGSKAYSIATAGCNFKCANCQNYDLSQTLVDEYCVMTRYVKPEEVVEQAVAKGCKSIAYTYTEPTIFFEYILDVAKLAHEKNLKNVFITNGYLTAEALETIAPYLDAVNLDLKSFSNEFYRNICRAKRLPVLEALKRLKRLGVWTEVTTLVIPTLNDTHRELELIAAFIADIGKEIPWHISAFYPAHKLVNLPPTSRELLHQAWEMGESYGLRYVYIGNSDETEFETTYCYNCGNALMRRRFNTLRENLLSNARCPFCSVTLDGIGLDIKIENPEVDVMNYETL